MSLSARAIAVSGIGFSALLVSVSGLLGPAAIIPPVPTPPAPSYMSGAGGGYAQPTRRSNIPRLDPSIADDEDILFIITLLERENLL